MDEANLPEGGDAIGDGEGGAAANNVNVNVNVIGNVDEDDTDNGSANAPAAAAAVAVAAADPAASQNRSSRSSSRPRRPPHRLVEELNRRHLGQREGGGGGGGGDRNNINAGRGRRGNRIGALRRQHQQYQQYRRGAPQHQPPLSRAVLVENSHEDDCDDWEELSPPELATWPKATPTPTGERYLSVCCDGIGWAWTNYAGADERFHPTVLWRTSRLNPAIFNKSNDATVDPMSHLRTFLPAEVQEFFFGEAAPGGNEPSTGPSVVTRNRAFRIAALREVPIVNVYVLMDSDEDLRAIAFLLSHMPVKIYRLCPADFVLGPLHGEPVLEEPSDRLAAVAGALAMTENKLPAMVVLAGPNVVTVTTVSVDYHVVGMGIACGIPAKLRALDHWGDDGRQPAAVAAAAAAIAAAAAPAMTYTAVRPYHELMKSVVENVTNRGTPIDLFNGATAETDLEQRVGSVLYEMGAYLTAAIASWKEDVKQHQLEEARQDSGVATTDATPSGRAVVVCGMDSGIVEAMLSSNHANLIHPPIVGHPEGGVETLVCKNLVSKGVQALLVSKYDALMEVCEGSGEERARRTALGCRVTTHFGSRAYRGTVVSVVVSKGSFDEDLYLVHYDDDDEEEYYPYELFEHLQLYSTTGEDWKANDDVSQEKLEAKKAQSRDAAELIDQFSAREASVAEAVPASPPLATQLDSKFDEESSSPLNRKVPANVNVAAASADAPSAASSIASATGVAAATAAVKKRKQPPTAQPSRGRGRGRGGGGRGGRPRLYPTLADLSNDPGAVVGRRIARYFDDPGTPGQVNLFFGSVYDFRMPDGDGIEDMVSEGLVLWDVRYDDGDEESLDAAELVEVLKLYQKNSSKDDAAPDAAAHAAGLGADTASVASERDDDDENADAADAEAAAAAPLPDAAA